MSRKKKGTARVTLYVDGRPVHVSVSSSEKVAHARLKGAAYKQAAYRKSLGTRLTGVSAGVKGLQERIAEECK